jgi:mannose-6-phosphate isomerase-like protein (cupin superfamily)
MTDANLSWRYPDRETAGSFEGEGTGSGVSFFVVDMAAGDGPRLHRHPYSETFVVQEGRARFRVGDRTVEAEAGEVVVAPPETAHGFKSLGPENLRMVTIHDSPKMQTEWLEAG